VAELFIGLISGTRMDGADTALLDCSTAQPRGIASYAGNYPPGLRRQLDVALQLEDPLAADLGALYLAVGEAFASAATTLPGNAGFTPGDITTIGSHGQTIRHEPNGPVPAFHKGYLRTPGKHV